MFLDVSGSLLVSFDGEWQDSNQLGSAKCQSWALWRENKVILVLGIITTRAILVLD